MVCLFLLRGRLYDLMCENRNADGEVILLPDTSLWEEKDFKLYSAGNFYLHSC